MCQSFAQFVGEVVVAANNEKVAAYRQWLADVDEILLNIYFSDTEEMADYPWVQWFEDGHTAHDAAWAAISDDTMMNAKAA